MSKKYKFPDGFLWGSVTSAHQVEGGLLNDWTEWEKENADRLAKEAKSKNAEWQQERFPEMFDPKNYISGKAADYYNLYEKDFDILKELGQNAFRLSIEWSRIESEEGKFDQKEIEHYKKVILALKKRNIEPFVTLWHWPFPLWVSEMGGFENKETIKYFLRYAEKMAEALPGVKFWITLNEPEVYASHSYLRGNWTPQKKSYFSYRKVIRNLVSVHKEAYKVIKKHIPNSKICVAKHNVYFEAYKNRPVNRILKYFADSWWNDWFLKKIKSYQDIISLNNYHHNRINYGFNKNANKKISDMGWELYPESLAMVALELKKYNLPIYVTEHGLTDADDSRREKFVKFSLACLHRAIESGVDVRGYLHWSLLDNFEWDKGFWPRFGLVEVDFKTMERKIRPSALEYAKICKTNTLEI
jgi:beta-glucosidase